MNMGKAKVAELMRAIEALSGASESELKALAFACLEAGVASGAGKPESGLLKDLATYFMNKRAVVLSSKP